jgi:hypothetical protein
MGKEPYICTTCNRTFSRKNNAERHNSSLHDEMAIIFNKDTGWRSDKAKENKSSFSLSFSSSKSPTDATTHNDTIPSSQVPYPSNLEDLKVGITDPEIDINTADEKFFEIFEKISPLIDELDILLSEYKYHEERINILSDGIILALMSPNPVRSLKDLINLQRLYKGITKASGFVSISKNITPAQALSMLKAMVLSAPYSKNKNKINN